MSRRTFAASLLALMLAACGRQAPPAPRAAEPAATLLTVAPVEGFANPEPGVAPQCYTRTDGASNPCWACHTSRNGRNDKGDWALQERYAFSEPALENHWRGLFTDRRQAIAATTDLSVARRGRFEQVRGACRRWCMYLRVATCTAVTRPLRGGGRRERGPRQHRAHSAAHIVPSLVRLLPRRAPADAAAPPRRRRRL